MVQDHIANLARSSCAHNPLDADNLADEGVLLLGHVDRDAALVPIRRGLCREFSKVSGLVHLRKSRVSPSEFSRRQWPNAITPESRVIFRICTEEIEGLAEREGRATWARRAYALKSNLGELCQLITTWTGSKYLVKMIKVSLGARCQCTFGHSWGTLSDSTRQLYRGQQNFLRKNDGHRWP